MKNNLFRFLIMSLIGVMLTSLLVGCTIGEFFEKEGEAVFSRELYQDELKTDAGPVFGGEVSLFCVDLDTLHPIYTQNIYVRMMSKLVFDSLFSVDKAQVAHESLVESYKNTDNNTIWEFTLKKGVSFHNGKGLKADDIIYTIKLILSSEDSFYYTNVKNILSTEYLGEDKLRIVLDKPDAQFRSRLTFPIVPDGFSIEPNNSNISKNDYVGTGQYKLEQYVAGKEITLIRAYPEKTKENSESEIGTEQSAYIERVRFHLYSGEGNIIDEFLMKRVDIAFVKQSEYVKYADRTDIVLKEYADYDANILIMNNQKSIFQNSEIRRAISYAIDREDILEQALLGAGEIADVLLYPSSYLLNGKQPYQTSTELSSQIFREQNCIINERDGKLYYRNYALSFNLLVNYESKEKVKTAELIKEQMKQNGIEIIIEELAFNDLLNRVNSGRYDMAIIGMRIPEVPDLGLIYGEAGISYGSNLTRYANPEIEKLLNDFNFAIDEEAQKLVFDDIYDIIMKDMPYTVLYFKNAGVLYNKKIRGNREPFFWNQLNELREWYILQ